ncbi:MAG: hypothetical protein K6E19_07135 [Lachnospiraceae bacterium]|nr:hypothetical protein [Lachnospiraceae bacterium]
MKKEDIFDAITDIDGSVIEEAGAMRRARIAKIIRYVGNIAAIFVIFIIVYRRGSMDKKALVENATMSSTEISYAAMAEESVTEGAMLEESMVEAASEATGESRKSLSSDALNDLVMGDDPNLLVASPIPEMAQKPDDELMFSEKGMAEYDSQMEAWSKDLEKYTANEPEADSSVDGFSGRLIRGFFETAGDENRILSPINVYFALAMLADTTDGNSRQELVDALGAQDIDSLRKNAVDLWNYNFRDDGVATSILGSSIWLSNEYNYNTQTLQNLSYYYNAESYSGEMGSDSLNESLHNWMNARTGNFLENQVGNLNLSRETVAAIVTTAYFKDSWTKSFEAFNNTELTFKGTKGEKETTFMNNSSRNVMYTGKGYRAMALPMNEGYDMLFIRPDEGYGPEDLFADNEALSLILSKYAETDSKTVRVDYSIPKFDAESTVELSDIVKAMGISDVFTGKADFTPLTADTTDLAVSDILHGARVKIDEDGCEAAAYTAITVGATAMPVDEPEEFILDKPFIYVIRNNMGAPLFVGVINNIE